MDIWIRDILDDKLSETKTLRGINLQYYSWTLLQFEFNPCSNKFMASTLYVMIYVCRPSLHMIEIYTSLLTMKSQSFRPFEILDFIP